MESNDEDCESVPLLKSEYYENPLHINRGNHEDFQESRSITTRVMLVLMLAVVSIMFFVSHRIIFHHDLPSTMNMSELSTTTSAQVKSIPMFYEETRVGLASPIISEAKPYNPYSISNIWNSMIGFFNPKLGI